LFDRYHARQHEAGRLVRRLQRAMASLWRKGSHGSASDTGKRWVERTLSLHHTCRQLSQSTFRLLVDAVTSLFGGRQPDLSWLY
jgi:hypothetical protein